MGFIQVKFAKSGGRLARYCFLVVASLVLCACGGGGDSSPAGSGGSLAITPTILRFLAESNGALQAPQSITATYSESNVAQVVAGYPSDITPPTWLDLIVTGTTSPVTVNVIPKSTALVPGFYTTTIVIATVTSNGTVISSRNATVTYQIVTVSVSPLSVNLTAVAGNPSAVVPVVITSGLDFHTWTTSTSYSNATTGWLSITPSSGQSLPATLSFSGNALPAGTYTATVTIGAGTFSAQLPVTYVVSP